MTKKESVKTAQQEFAYAPIINALAGGLYPNKFHVIREYVQNAFDALVNWKANMKDKDVSIKISIQKPSIFIFDNGTGMDRRALNEYRKVGFSKKIVGESVGFRGIGKLAGISVAKKLVVTTSPYGTPEKFTLVFDAESMLKEINELKRKGETPSLNAVIEKHTQLTSALEEKDKHYTIVELQGIKPDSKILFNKEKLIDYLSKNVPVPFDPNFAYGKNIEDDIRQFVQDYNCVNISVGEKHVYKPFAKKLKPHQHILIWDKKKKLLAYCWYCENNEKGQIKPSELNGLIYRYKNFAVGDQQLTRKTIWDTSSHLAFYFMGEIYITDTNIVPTSQRDDFEQSKERERFYKEANTEIANELNHIARESSDIRRAKEYVDSGAKIISTIDHDIKQGEFYIRDLSAEKIAQLVNIVNNIEARKQNIPAKDTTTKFLANKVVKKARKLLKTFKEVEKPEKEGHNIIRQLDLNKQAEQVYSTTIRTIKDFFVSNPSELEQLIRLFHKNLSNTFQKR